MLGPNDFVGVWQLERKLEDRLGVMDGTLVGKAVFDGGGDADLGGLRYEESGSLTLASGGVMQATRTYYWQFDDSEVHVRFADGMPFHGFVPHGQSAGTPHLCGADLYVCAYDFTHWPAWKAVWTVKGPSKDYISTSHYRR
ncbi:DUF6314 family protein [Yoonia sp. 208BN28-4]|uniref:DUF6314 family protein n=1 Tax=Yoonia sp. 208BN28-4 TaxID=3126505 RepID=UPI0030995542